VFIGKEKTMRRQPWGFGVLALCAIGLVCSGIACNRGPKLPPMAKTSGTVTFNGKPVTGGVIIFVPDPSKGSDGPMGIGEIDQSGHYRIRTLRVEGALVGWHKVRIEDPMAGGPPRVAGPVQIPGFYAKAETSGLTAEVKAGQDNQIDFALTPKR
jgi:hypothetical protein